MRFLVLFESFRSPCFCASGRHPALFRSHSKSNHSRHLILWGRVEVGPAGSSEENPQIKNSLRRLCSCPPPPTPCTFTHYGNKSGCLVHFVQLCVWICLSNIVLSWYSVWNYIHTGHVMQLELLTVDENWTEYPLAFQIGTNSTNSLQSLLLTTSGSNVAMAL